MRTWPIVKEGKMFVPRIPRDEYQNLALNYTIGDKYQYPGGGKKYKLIKVVGWKYLFECGHWCTDSVFLDLFNCRTGLQVWEDV